MKILHKLQFQENYSQNIVQFFSSIKPNNGINNNKNYEKLEERKD